MAQLGSQVKLPGAPGYPGLVSLPFPTSASSAAPTDPVDRASSVRSETVDGSPLF